MDFIRLKGEAKGRYFGLLYKLAGEEWEVRPRLAAGWAADLDEAEAKLEEMEPKAIVVWGYARDGFLPAAALREEVERDWTSGVGEDHEWELGAG